MRVRHGHSQGARSACKAEHSHNLLDEKTERGTGADQTASTENRDETVAPPAPRRTRAPSARAGTSEDQFLPYRAWQQ